MDDLNSAALGIGLAALWLGLVLGVTMTLLVLRRRQLRDAVRRVVGYAW